MTKKDVTELLAVLQTAYPYFYSKKTKEELLAIAQIWEKKFANDDVRIVSLALDKIIETEEFPPSIATIKNYISRFEQYATSGNTLAELWDKFMYACHDATYNAQKQFDDLPRILQLFVGNARQLRRYGEMQESDLERYVRSSFDKELPLLRERVKFENETSPEQKQLLAEAANNKLSAAKVTKALPSH